MPTFLFISQTVAIRALIISKGSEMENDQFIELIKERMSLKTNECNIAYLSKPQYSSRD